MWPTLLRTISRPFSTPENSNILYFFSRFLAFHRIILRIETRYNLRTAGWTVKRALKCHVSVKLWKKGAYSELYIKKEGIEIFFIVTDIIILYNQYPWLLSNNRVLLSVDPCHFIYF